MHPLELRHVDALDLGQRVLEPAQIEQVAVSASLAMTSYAPSLVPISIARPRRDPSVGAIIRVSSSVSRRGQVDEGSGALPSKADSVLVSAWHVLVDDAALHDEGDAPDGSDIGQRIAVKGDDVRLKAPSNRTDPIAHAERLGGKRVG